MLVWACSRGCLTCLDRVWSLSICVMHIESFNGGHAWESDYTCKFSNLWEYGISTAIDGYKRRNDLPVQSFKSIQIFL